LPGLVPRQYCTPGRLACARIVCLGAAYSVSCDACVAASPLFFFLISTLLQAGSACRPGCKGTHAPHSLSLGSPCNTIMKPCASEQAAQLLLMPPRAPARAWVHPECRRASPHTGATRQQGALSGRQSSHPDQSREPDMRCNLNMSRLHRHLHTVAGTHAHSSPPGCSSSAHALALHQTLCLHLMPHLRASMAARPSPRSLACSRLGHRSSGAAAARSLSPCSLSGCRTPCSPSRPSDRSSASARAACSRLRTQRQRSRAGTSTVLGTGRAPAHKQANLGSAQIMHEDSPQPVPLPCFTRHRALL